MFIPPKEMVNCIFPYRKAKLEPFPCKTTNSEIMECIW